MAYKLRVPRAIPVLAAILMVLTAVSQVVAAPDSSIDPVTDAGQVHHLAGGHDAATRERVRGYEIANPDRDLNVVVGSDERVQVTQTDQYPNSAIAYIEAWSDAEELAFRCTATFIAPNVLLTAAHCLYVPEFGGWPDGVEVVPGITGEYEPFGYEYAADIWVPGGWIDANGDINNDTGRASDYGLIKLADNTLGDQVGSWEIGVLSTETLQAADFNPTTTGYPADKAEITQWFGSQPNFLFVDNVLLEHDIDSFQGQSGSAVWRGADRTIVGVVSFETQSHNYARRIDQTVLDGLLAGCEQMSCSFNYFIEGQQTPPPPSGNGDTSAFTRTWNRTDKPVQDGEVSRTWMWGPPFTDIVMERYDDSPGGERAVLYHEKSRMEITNPSGDPSSIWYITNGLIAKEMVTGNLQLGNDTFEQHQPAQINAAGDPGDENGVTYATFGSVLNAEPLAEGTAITNTINRAGEVGDDPGVAGQGVTAAMYVPETNHTVASVFWDFMNSSGTVYENGQFFEAQLFENAYFATGYPITEAYWTTVEVGGTPRQVLIQVFERRVLTYTPGNPPGWDVEAGNVGTHYHTWRYELIPAEGDETPPPDPDPTPTPPADGVPAEGDTVFLSDLTEVPPIEGDLGAFGAASAEGYTITTPPGSELAIVTQDEFGDGSYSIQSRVTTPAPMGAGCLIIAATPDGTSAHQFCATYGTGASATADLSGHDLQQATAQAIDIVGLYQSGDSFESTGEWQITPVDAGTWHELKVVMSGGTFWVLYDGALIGSFAHESPSTGNIGFSALNLEGTGGLGTTTDQILSILTSRTPTQSSTNAQVEFTDLTAKALQ